MCRVLALAVALAVAVAFILAVEVRCWCDLPDRGWGLWSGRAVVPGFVVIGGYAELIKVRVTGSGGELSN